RPPSIIRPTIPSKGGVSNANMTSVYPGRLVPGCWGGWRRVMVGSLVRDGHDRSRAECVGLGRATEDICVARASQDVIAVDRRPSGAHRDLHSVPVLRAVTAGRP